MIDNRERGQATLELVLCLPFVALLIAALIDIGGLNADRVRLWHAAREAARVAAVDPDLDRIEGAARAVLPGSRIEVEPADRYRVQGEPVEVTARFTPDATLPLVGPVFERELTASVTMRIERP